MTDYYQKHIEERRAYQKAYQKMRKQLEKTKLQRQQHQKQLQLFAEVINN